MKICLLGSLTCQFRHSGYRFTLFLRLLNLLQHHIGHVRMLVQIVIDLSLYKITYKLINGRTTGSHIGRAQLDFSLTFEQRFLHINGNGSYQSVTDIGIVHILVEIFLDGTGYMLFESTLVRTSLCGVLSVDKRVIFLTILAGMRKSDLDIFSFQVDDGI